jgi:membrane protein YqaA with SNARE-associated domain
MHQIAHGLFAFVLKFGGLGLIVLGLLDSSFLFAPLSNDLLLVAMTARHHSVPNMLYYAIMSSIGSVLGCLLVDLTLRRAGEKGLEKHLSPRRLERVKSKVRQNAARALVLASLAPPPFPFTPFVMAAAALQYSRSRLLATVAAARLVRFTVLGMLALRFGERILQWTQNPAVQGFLIALVVLCTVGSALSVYQWIRRSRS